LKPDTTPAAETGKSLFAGVDDREAVLDAQRLLKEGKYQTAITALRELIKTEDAPGIKFLLGNALYLSGKLDKAAKAYNEVIKVCPGSLEAYRNLGKVLSTAGKYLEAIPLLAAGLRGGAGTTDDRKLLARLNMLVGNYFGAETVFKEILSGDPGNFETKLLLGQCFLYQNRATEAEVVAQEVLAAEPISISALELYARALARQGKYDRTADVLELLRFSGSLDSRLLKMLGDIYVTFELPEEALEAYREAGGGEVGPHDLERVGLSFWHAGMLGNATEVFRAVTRKSSSITANTYLGHIYLMSGDYDAAIKHVKAASELGANIGDVSILLGRAQFLKKCHNEAIAHFKAALFVSFSKVKAQIGLGDVYRAKGQLDEALEWYTKALHEDPGNRELRRLIQILTQQRSP
jgi:tetratricopeptide (TPR) repeat protein